MARLVVALTISEGLCRLERFRFIGTWPEGE